MTDTPDEGPPLHFESALDKWRREADEAAREREQRKQEMQRREPTAASGVRAELYSLIRELRGEIGVLRAEVSVLKEATGQALGECTAELANSLTADLDRAVRKIQDSFWNELARRFAELSARIDQIPGGGRKDFKFASEKEPEDSVPNPLRKDLN